MRLLVSVRNADEASAALEGGADIIDAKEPSSGALGAVALPALRGIVATVGDARLVTAALGDAVHERQIAQTAHAYARGGARLVKVGFSGVSSRPRVAALVAAAGDGAGAHAGVIATAYADAGLVGSLDPFAIVDAAATAGAAGVLLDTAVKQGPGLRELMPLPLLRSWVTIAREARLLVAVAGKLTADDLRHVNDARPDIVGVRGAACHSGRTGRIASENVRDLARVLLGLTVLPAGEPVEQRDRPSNRTDGQKKNERVDHQGSPA
jgi:uncharacterized protein (UPF0264 family)